MWLRNVTGGARWREEETLEPQSRVPAPVFARIAAITEILSARRRAGRTLSPFHIPPFKIEFRR